MSEVKIELYGKEQATVLVEDWYEMFEWSENPLFKDAMIEIIRKYDKNVVRKVIKRLTMEFTPKYLPTLSKIDQAMMHERLNQKQSHKNIGTLDDLGNSEEGGDVQSLYIKGLKRLMKDLSSNKITKEEYYKKQGDFFKFHNRTDDANFFYENARRSAKGLQKLLPEEWERSSKRSS